MQSNLSEEREKLVKSLGLDEDMTWALNDMFHTVEFERGFGLKAEQEMSNIIGAMTFLEHARKIDQDQAEDLWTMWAKYEAEGSKQNEAAGVAD